MPPGTERFPGRVAFTLAQVNVDCATESLGARYAFFGANRIELGKLVVPKVYDRPHGVIIA